MLWGRCEAEALIFKFIVDSAMKKIFQCFYVQRQFVFVLLHQLRSTEMSEKKMNNIFLKVEALSLNILQNHSNFKFSGLTG